MKLAFGTLGCPTWTFDQVLDAAQRYGYDGIEFRGMLNEIDLVNVPEFMPGQIEQTRLRLETAGVGAACLSSSVQVVASTASEVDRQAAMAHAKRYVQMAKEVGAPYIRLFCGGVPADMMRDEALARATDSLREIGDFAQARNIVATVETHDAFIRTEELMELIRRVDHSAVQVLWDVHHPYRMAGESVEHSMRYLDGYIRHTHIKDSVLNADGDGYTYVLLGHGDVPILEALRALNKTGYDGYLALEWEKRWIPELAEPEEVIPQYIDQMRAWLAEL
ncbi:MAG: sugar phosphate isomerase/epimerase family protein [Armatimonadota bacterium]